VSLCEGICGNHWAVASITSKRFHHVLAVELQEQAQKVIRANLMPDTSSSS